MKFLTLVRHSSAVHDSSFRDFDRPLRQKGKDKITRNTKLIIEAGIKPDLFISSPALRAYQTAELFIKNLDIGFSEDDIIQDESLYLPSPGDILDTVRSIDNRFKEVFLFSHNNGISWAAQEFCGDRSIIMPTGCAVRILFNIDSWSDVLFGSGEKAAVFP